MLSLKEIQKTSIADLHRLAADTENRQYSIALTQMAHAQYAHSIGDTASLKAHYEAARRAHVRAQEDETGQVMRAQRTQAEVEKMGVALDSEEGKVVARNSVRGFFTFKWNENASDV